MAVRKRHSRARRILRRRPRPRKAPGKKRFAKVHHKEHKPAKPRFGFHPRPGRQGKGPVHSPLQSKPRIPQPKKPGKPRFSLPRKRAVAAPRTLTVPKAPAVTHEGAIETEIDRLYSFVTSKKSVAVGDAARAFAVPEEKIEEWAGILEEHRLIRLHYPKIGKPVLLAAEAKPASGKSQGAKLPVPPKKPRRGPALFLLPALAVVLGLVALRNPGLFQSIPEAGFLIQAAIGIVVLLAVFLAVRKARRKRAARLKPARRKKGGR